METHTAEPTVAGSDFLRALKEFAFFLDLPQAMQKVADLGYSVLGARSCTVRLREKETGDLVLRGVRGVTEEGHARQWHRLRSTDSIVGQVVKSGTPYDCPDIQADDHYAMKDFARANGLVALRSQPIVVRGQVAGVITLYFGSAQEITEERKGLAQLLAQFAQHVVDTEHKPPFPVHGTDEIDLSSQLEGARGISEASTAICSLALKLSGWQAAGLFMPAGLLGILEPVARVGHGDLLDVPQVQELTRRAFSLGAAQEQAIRPPGNLLFPPRYAVSVPCPLAEEQVAVLTVASLSPQPMAQESVSGLRQIAKRSAEALYRLRQAERLEAMEELLATLGVSRDARQDPAKLREDLLNLARGQLGVEGSVLYLWDAETQRYTPREARGFKNILRPLKYAGQTTRVGRGGAPLWSA